MKRDVAAVVSAFELGFLFLHNLFRVTLDGSSAALVVAFVVEAYVFCSRYPF